MARKRDSARSSGEYAVGYGKPPTAGRFKKGVSGNPKGRAKGSKNFGALLIEELRMPMIITEGGERRSITKEKAVIKQLVHRAAAGDLRALALLLTQYRVAGAEADQRGADSELSDTEEDAAVIAGLLARMGVQQEEEGP